MKIYKFYLVIDIKKDERLYDLIDHKNLHITENRLIYLYAFTTEKKIAESFSKSRNKEKLIMKEDKINKDEYELFESQMKINKITECEISISKNQYAIVYLTKYEYMTAIDEFFQVLNFEYDELDYTNPEIFKSSYYNALNKIMYNYYYYTLHGTSDEAELEDYNLSFNQFIYNMYKNDIKKICYIYRDLIIIDNFLSEVQII